MFKRKLTHPELLLIAVNLAPIAGVLFANWDPIQVFLAYCLETIVIGFFTLVKLGIATWYRKTDDWPNEGQTTRQNGIFFMFFFLIHYGMFVGIQTTLFLHASNFGGPSGSPSIFQLLSHPGRYLATEAWLLILLYGLCYAYENLTVYFRSEDYLKKPMFEIMFEPYGRIFIQQFTVILGGFVLAFGASTIFIIIFALAKAFFSIFFTTLISNRFQMLRKK
jgi:hypothetical protein